MIEEQGVTEISEAVTAYRSVSKSRAFREMERLREKAENDEASRLHNAKRKAAQKEKINIAKKLLKRNLSIEEIAEDTNLTIEEIENLKPLT